MYGFYDYKNEDYFKRLPDSVAEIISDGVNSCRMESAGGRIRFSTNSKYIVLKAEFDFGFVKYADALEPILSKLL